MSIKRTEIQIGDVQQKRISVEEAVERIAIVVDANADKSEVLCKKYKELHEAVHGCEDGGGLVEEVARIDERATANTRLIYASIFLLVMSITILSPSLR